MNSCIYTGTVSHKRRLPSPHSFRYRMFMMYLDLDELPDLFDGHLFWSARKAAPAWFRREDYFGDPRQSLSLAVRDEAERQTGKRPLGPIRVLTHMRYFGYIQNPVTFYYCFNSDGKKIETILAEITNTPWKERHTYALAPGEGSEDGVTGRAHRFAKEFHVSPFMDMNHDYEWSFTEPGDHLAVHMKNTSLGTRMFDATLTMKRSAITGTSLAGVLLRYPFMTARIALAIYWQALRLWIKRTPCYTHPKKRTA